MRNSWKWNTLFLLGLAVSLLFTACSNSASSPSQVSNLPPMELTDQELGDRWGLFQVTLNEEDVLYHFGVKPAGEPAPKKSEMESDLNVKKYTVGSNSINIILATVMGSPLIPFFDAATNDASAQAKWIDTNMSFSDANIMTGSNEFAAKRSLLAPETAYKVYILENGGRTVRMIHEFTTAAVDLTSTAAGLDILSNKLQTETVTFHTDNYEVFPLQMKDFATPDTVVLPHGDGPTSGSYWYQNDFRLSPVYFPRDNRAEFYFYVGTTADYGNSPRLWSLRGFFMTIKKGMNSDLVFPLKLYSIPPNEAIFEPTINYQQ